MYNSFRFQTKEIVIFMTISSVGIMSVCTQIKVNIVYKTNNLLYIIKKTSPLRSAKKPKTFRNNSYARNILTRISDVNLA